MGHAFKAAKLLIKLKIISILIIQLILPLRWASLIRPAPTESSRVGRQQG